MLEHTSATTIGGFRSQPERCNNAALGSAVLYGAADFLGGLGARRTSTLAIVTTSQGVGLVLLAFLLPLLPEAEPSARGSVVGRRGRTGRWYRGGAAVSGARGGKDGGRSPPTAAVCVVMIPVVTGALLGERLAPLTIFGIVLAIRSHRARQSAGCGCSGGGAPGEASAWCRDRPRGGCGDRLILSCPLPQRTPGRGCGLCWRPVPSQCPASVWLLWLARDGCGWRRPSATIAVAAGAIDMGANALYLLAIRYGSLSVAVTLSSLYPVLCQNSALLK